MSGVPANPARALSAPPGLRTNSLFGALGLIIPSAILVAAYPPILVGIGPDSFGIFVLATTLATLGLIADLGVGAAATHFLARDLGTSRDHAAEALVTCFAFYALAGLLVGACVWIVSPPLAEVFRGSAPLQQVTWTFRLAGIQLWLLFLIQPLLATLKGLQRFDLVAVMSSIIAIASLGGSLMSMMIVSKDVVGVMAGYAAGHVVAVGLGAALVFRALGQRGVTLAGTPPSVASLRRLVAFGLAFTGGAIASVLMYHPQRLVLGASIGPTAVTVYQLATVIPSRAQALVATATEALYPYASSSPTPTVLRRAYIRMLVAGAITAGVLLAALVLVREPLFEAWIGDSVASEVASLLPIPAAAYFFITLSAAPYYLGNGLGRPHIVMAVYLAAGGLNAIILVGMLGATPSVESVAWVFLAVNILACVAYQVVAETKLWRTISQGW